MTFRHKVRSVVEREVFNWRNAFTIRVREDGDDRHHVQFDLAGFLVYTALVAIVARWVF